MSTDQSTIEIEYPESDGQPMGETDLHRNWMVRIIDLLQQRYRGQHVYVTGDLLLYYKEGEPTRFVVPDAFVVLDSDPGPRRTYKLWEEKQSPNAVFEVTSRWTKREDVTNKPRKFAEIGVAEYFMYDPTSDYLVPPLRGFRLTDDQHVPIEPDASGSLISEQLNLRLRIEAGELVMYDLDTNERQLTEAEAERAALELERAAREDAEVELQRLRKLLDEREDSV